MKSNEDIIARRFREAERLTLRDRPPEEKRQWLKTFCPNCKAKVEYAPREYFRGALYCGNCGKSFKLTRLDDFVEERLR